MPENEVQVGGLGGKEGDFEFLQEIDAMDHLGQWYQAFVIETAHDGIAVHFSGWSQIWDEFVPTSQISTRTRARGKGTAVGQWGPEPKEDVRALYSGFTSKEQDTMRLLRKGKLPDGTSVEKSDLAAAAAAAAAAPVAPQDLKRELAAFKESLATTENMLALFVRAHASVASADAKAILEVKEMVQTARLLMNR